MGTHPALLPAFFCLQDNVKVLAALSNLKRYYLKQPRLVSNYIIAYDSSPNCQYKRSSMGLVFSSTNLSPHSRSILPGGGGSPRLLQYGLPLIRTCSFLDQAVNRQSTSHHAQCLSWHRPTGPRNVKKAFISLYFSNPPKQAQHITPQTARLRPAVVSCCILGHLCWTLVC